MDLVADDRLAQRRGIALHDDRFRFGRLHPLPLPLHFLQSPPGLGKRARQIKIFAGLGVELFAVRLEFLLQDRQEGGQLVALLESRQPLALHGANLFHRAVDVLTYRPLGGQILLQLARGGIDAGVGDRGRLQRDVLGAEPGHHHQDDEDAHDVRHHVQQRIVAGRGGVFAAVTRHGYPSCLRTSSPLPSKRAFNSSKRASPLGATWKFSTGRQYMPLPAMPQVSM